MELLLGPSLLGWIAPQSFEFVFRSAAPEPLQVLSGLGLVLVMFQIGLGFDFSHLTERDNHTLVVHLSAACLALPFGIGLAFGYYPGIVAEANRLDAALFVATAFLITAFAGAEAHPARPLNHAYTAGGDRHRRRRGKRCCWLAAARFGHRPVDRDI